MTPHTDSIDLDEVGDVVVPDDLAAALRRSAGAVPPGGLDPREPRRRHASRQRRRRAATVGLGLTTAAALVTAVLVANAVDTADPARDGPEVAVADQPALAELDGVDVPAEGLPLDEPDVPVLLPGAGAELQPDGSVAPLPRAEPGDAPTGEAVRLSDGRLVTLATRAPQPGGAGDLAYVLAVFDADGTLLGQDVLGARGGQVLLAGVRDDRIVVVGSSADGDCCEGGVQVATVDPDTFERTAVAEVDHMPDAAAAAGDRLVLVDEPGAAECPVTVVDLSDGSAQGAAQEVAALSCMGLEAVTISPDGSLAGVVIQRRAGIPATASAIERQDIVDRAVVFVALDDGEARGSYRFDIAAVCPAVGDDPCARPRQPVAYRGLAWVDDDHVELVVQDPGPPPGGADLLDGGPLVPERLRTILVDVAVL